MDTRDQQKLSEHGAHLDERYEEPGLGAWIKRNPWLLVRLFIVLVFTFGASTTAANFSYGLQGEPIPLTVEQLNRGDLPSGIQLGDYVEVTGTPDLGPDTQRIGTPESGIGVSSRYSAAYFYFALEETGDTPEYYRQIFPAYSAILALWVLSIAWLVWKKNKPILGL